MFMLWSPPRKACHDQVPLIHLAVWHRPHAFEQSAQVATLDHSVYRHHIQLLIIDASLCPFHALYHVLASLGQDPPDHQGLQTLDFVLFHRLREQGRLLLLLQ